MKHHLRRGAWRDIDHTCLAEYGVLVRSRIGSKYGLGSQAIVAFSLFAFTGIGHSKERNEIRKFVYSGNRYFFIPQCKASCTIMDVAGRIHYDGQIGSGLLMPEGPIFSYFVFLSFLVLLPNLFAISSGHYMCVITLSVLNLFHYTTETINLFFKQIILTRTPSATSSNLTCFLFLDPS